jgi:hypothetical protein
MQTGLLSLFGHGMKIRPRHDEILVFDTLDCQCPQAQE